MHQLVAEAFLGPRPEGHGVNHLSGDKLNNAPENLEWATQQRNVRHSFDLGLQKPKRGAGHPRARLTEAQVQAIRARSAAGERRIDVAKDYGVSASAITEIVRGRAWRHLSSARPSGAAE